MLPGFLHASPGGRCCPLLVQVVPGFRVRTIPVLGTMPAIFGMAAASYILCQLAGQPFTSEPLFQLQVWLLSMPSAAFLMIAALPCSQLWCPGQPLQCSSSARTSMGLSCSCDTCPASATE